MATERQVRRALEKFSDELMERPNVVGLGVVRCKVDDEPGLSPALAVYVKRKLNKGRNAGRNAAKRAIPTSLELLGRGKAVRIPVTVIEQGEVSLETL